MQSFFISLITASVIGALSSALVCKTYEKYIKYIAALICTAIVISPLNGVISKIENLVSRTESTSEHSEHQTAQQANLLIASKTEENAEDYVSNLVFSDLGIRTHSMNIEIESEGTEFSIKSVTATTDSEAEIEPLKKYLQKLFGQGTQIEVMG